MELVEADTQGQADVATTAVARLGDNVIGVIGPMLSGETRAVGALLESAGLPFVSPSASGDDLGKQHWKAFHGAFPANRYQAAAAAKAFGALGVDGIYVVSSVDSYSEAQSNAIKGTSVKVVGSTVIRSAAEATSAGSTVARSGADGVYFAGYVQEAVPFLKALRRPATRAT